MIFNVLSGHENHVISSDERWYFYFLNCTKDDQVVAFLRIFNETGFILFLYPNYILYNSQA